VTDPPRRPRYINGLMLSARDLEAEQTYHRQMRYLANRLCGVGVAEGLDVTLVGRGVVIPSLSTLGEAPGWSRSVP